MTNPLEVLLNATTPTQFFIHAFELARDRPYLTNFTVMSPTNYEGESALTFSIDLTILYHEQNQEFFNTETVYTFTLTEHDQLIWEIKGREPIIGLDQIKKVLSQEQNTESSDLHNQLPSGTDDVTTFFPAPTK